MTRPILTAQLIRQAFLESLSDRIGNYTVKNAVTKAIYIGSKVPKNFVASGLEILISPTAKIAQIQPLINSGAVIYPEFEVRLIERTESRSLDDVINWTIAKFSVTRPPSIFDETEEAFHQASIRIPDYIAVTL
jgi:hypothetical protein